MKKIIAILLVGVILLNGVVYGNKKAARPMRQYIECRPLIQKLAKDSKKATAFQPALPAVLIF